MAERKIVPLVDTLPGSEEARGILQQRFYLDGALKELEQQRQQLDERLLFFAQAWQVELEEGEPCLFEARADGGTPLRMGVYQNKGRKEIKVELLLLQGISVEQIEKATVEGALGKVYLRVTKGKDSA